MDLLIAELKSVLGPAGVLEGDAIGAAYQTDWSGAPPVVPRLVVRPASTSEVAAVLRLCNAARQPVVPQGGMTGLVAGAVPGENEIALSLARMNRIEAVDRAARTITVQAGAPLQAVQDHAEAHGLMLPLDLGARGSCAIGGNISTNAGGNRVIRYGMTRDMVLGLEAVLPDGTVIDAMNTMLKNNAGYDIKHLFIGTEGTLGVVTRAVLRLRPQPASQCTAIAAVRDFDALVALLGVVDRDLGGTLSAFEAMWNDFYRMVTGPEVGVRAPLGRDYPLYVLIESLGADPERDAERFETVLERAMKDELMLDAVVARSKSDSAALWAVRDGIAEAVKVMAPFVSYDVSLPLGAMERFVAEAKQLLNEKFPGRPSVFFGHVGDGNLHLVTGLGSRDPDVNRAVDDLVYGVTGRLDGSVSAEHGIGRLKLPYLAISRGPAEIALMRTLKRAIDPNNILNPGRVLGD
ncbi:MAG TPA: FAD-binding oxidoreductase [Alphaproteobacteria bacterium]